MFLYVARNSARVSKNLVRVAAFGHLQIISLRMLLFFLCNSVIIYSGVKNRVRYSEYGDLILSLQVEANCAAYFSFVIVKCLQWLCIILKAR